MSAEHVFDRRQQVPVTPLAAAPQVSITFGGEFIEMIDRLVDSLEATSRGGDEQERRRLAVATAVSVLSDYAGEPLFVRRGGLDLEIKDLWR